MHEIIAKVARFAASKFAAFCYAVAVGVAGNVAFNMVEQHHSAATVSPAVEATAERGAVNPAPAPPNTPNPPSRGSGDPAPIRASQPATPPPATRQAGPAAAVPALPEPPAVTLPSPAAMAAPPLKPAVLPSEAATKPMATPPADATALAAPDSPNAAPAQPAPSPPAMPLHGARADDAPAPALPPVAALPPLAPAIDVAAPPTPPARLPAPPTRVTALPGAGRSPEFPAKRTTPSEQSSGGLELSDVWHPGRAVEKGLDWAGRQVPLIGDSDPEPHAAIPEPSAPISLLPPAVEAASSDNTSSDNAGAATPRKPAAPGPGHGGLY